MFYKLYHCKGRRKQNKILDDYGQHDSAEDETLSPALISFSEPEDGTDKYDDARDLTDEDEKIPYFDEVGDEEVGEVLQGGLHE